PCCVRERVRQASFPVGYTNTCLFTHILLEVQFPNMIQPLSKSMRCLQRETTWGRVAFVSKSIFTTCDTTSCQNPCSS
uniref:Uncharacterized protein n=1 Tax=Globisporangium ultimum (strain ATCC 200006 / CBS 805.95 / DAOM BR144) TaxID=431595 RepID=K3WT03_GLOUD